MTTEEILKFLKVERQESATQWRAWCPAHADGARPSLSVGSLPDGRTVVKCFSGCRFPAIVEAIGLKPADFRPADDAAADTASKIVRTYPYTDAAGTLLFEVVRWGPVKRFSQRRPPVAGDENKRGPNGKPRIVTAPTGDRWVWTLGLPPDYGRTQVTRVLYHLPDVLATCKAGGTVWIVEGEKDADVLAALRLTATCNPGGANKWHPRFARDLTGAGCVVIVPDGDADPYPGQRHAADVARSLLALPVPPPIKVLDLPDGAKDAADWFRGMQAANADPDTIINALPALANAAPDAATWLRTWEPRLALASPLPAGPHPRPAVHTFTPGQRAVLDALNASGGTGTLKGLCDRLKLSRSALQERLAPLVRRGEVEARAVPGGATVYTVPGCTDPYAPGAGGEGDGVPGGTDPYATDPAVPGPASQPGTSPGTFSTNPEAGLPSVPGCRAVYERSGTCVGSSGSYATRSGEPLGEDTYPGPHGPAIPLPPKPPVPSARPALGFAAFGLDLDPDPAPKCIDTAAVAAVSMHFGTPAPIGPCLGGCGRNPGPGGEGGHAILPGPDGGPPGWVCDACYNADD